MDADLTSLPAHLQLNIITAIVVIKLLGQFYSSVRNGGGLRRIFLSFWFGENLPKPVADDYKQELSKPPFSPNDPQVTP